MIETSDIAAISTASGASAIAIVRVSGRNSWSIVQSIFTLASSKIRALPDHIPTSSQVNNLLNHTHITTQLNSPWQARFALHGFIKDGNDIIDEVIVLPYKAPNSYTGEDMVEINCHGSIIISETILQLILKQGASLAMRGEFTKRAYLNGKLDLMQAEAVLDIIQSKTTRSASLSLGILQGHLGDKIKNIRQGLIKLLTRMVATIDFPDEIGDYDGGFDVQELKIHIEMLNTLVKTATTGVFLRQGLKIAIVGNPNVGKSSLLNQLLNFERAIVTPHAGTTRDFIEEPLDLNGIPVILIDTAGIRETKNEVEKIGIERSINALIQADLILLVTDITDDNIIDINLQKQVLNKPFFLLLNKIDLINDMEHTINKQYQQLEVSNNYITTTRISAKTNFGITELISCIETWVCQNINFADTGGSLNQRQAHLCSLAVSALNNAIQAIEQELPLDCLTTDLKEAIDSLSEICGIEVSTEIINSVFENFCVGK